MPEGFPLVHVGDMHLDDRDLDSANRIPDGNGIMGERCGIEHNPVYSPQAAMQMINYRAFGIGLKKIECHTQALGFGRNFCIDLIQRLASVDSYLPPSKHVQVGTMNNREAAIPHPKPPFCRDPAITRHRLSRVAQHAIQRNTTVSKGFIQQLPVPALSQLVYTRSMILHLQVRLFASLRKWAKETTLAVEVPDPATIRSALVALGIPENEVMVAMINGMRADFDVTLSEGDDIQLFPLLGGG